MIPKIIHYCWFGGNPLPDSVKKYIDTWRLFCPDYEIRECNESNFNIDCCDYVRDAYKSKKWAFVSDYARFYILYKMGGIYLDTDIEMLKSFDDLLHNRCFFGFGHVDTLTLPVFGSEPNHPFFYDVIEDYHTRRFINEDGSLDTTTIERTAMRILTNKYQLVLNGKNQILDYGVHIYPPECFYSTQWDTGEIVLNPQLYVIHYCEGTWLSDDEQMYVKLMRKYNKLLGKKIGSLVAIFEYSVATKGIKQTFIRAIKRLYGKI